MDVTKIQINYILNLTNEEFRLVTRSLGTTLGGNIKWTAPERMALAELNLKLLRIRAETLTHMTEQAHGAVERAQEFITQTLPPTPPFGLVG